MSKKPLSPTEKRSAGRPWLVITDPSGDFAGRAFRNFDLKINHVNHWPRGIIFWNQKTGTVKKWNGSTFDVFIPVKKTQESQKVVA